MTHTAKADESAESAAGTAAAEGFSTIADAEHEIYSLREIRRRESDGALRLAEMLRAHGFENPRGPEAPMLPLYQWALEVIAELVQLRDLVADEPSLLEGETALETFDRNGMASRINITELEIVEHYRKIIAAAHAAQDAQSSTAQPADPEADRRAER